MLYIIKLHEEAYIIRTHNLLLEGDLTQVELALSAQGFVDEEVKDTLNKLDELPEATDCLSFIELSIS